MRSSSRVPAPTAVESWMWSGAEQTVLTSRKQNAQVNSSPSPHSVFSCVCGLYVV